MARGTCYEFSLLWVFHIAIKGLRKATFQTESVPDLPAELDSHLLAAKAHELWDELDNKHRHRLYTVLYKMSKPYLIFGMGQSFIQGLVTTVVRPLLIRIMVAELAADADLSLLLVYVACLAIALLVEGWSSVSLKHAGSDYLGTIWFASTSSLILRKSLRIPSGTTDLEESSLLGNDIVRTYENLRFFCIFPMAVISLVGGIVVLVVTLGLSSLIGISVMVVVLLINAVIASKAQTAEEHDLAASDNRLSLMTQIISGIKAIKLSAWEDSFLALIGSARQTEMKCLREYRILHQSTVQIGRACPSVAAASSFIFLAARGNYISSSDLFAALNVFLALRLPLIVIPECITYFGALTVSINRLERFLSLAEVGGNFEGSVLVTDSTYRLKGSFMWHGNSDENLTLNSKTSFEMTNVKSLSRKPSSYGPFVLHELDISMKQGGQTLAIVGPVGSGKSSLCTALLGELKETSLGASAMNSFLSSANTGYIPQTSFVISGSILENIIFGRSYDPSNNSIATVLQQSALVEDLKYLPHGLETQIGERGVTLSGGQKTRLAIARALYSSPDLLIIDDCLAAVDAKVAQEIFSSIIQLGSSCTVIMAINQLRFLKYFDRIIVLQHGRVVKQGDTKEMIQDPIITSLLPELPTEDPAVQEDVEVRAPSMKDDKNYTSTNVIVFEEKRTHGSVKGKIISNYIKGMGLGWVAAGTLSGIITYSLMAGTDLWLSSWVSVANDPDTDSVSFALVYGIGILAYLVFLLVTSSIFSKAGVRSSQHLHDNCMDTILHAPITWFEATPSGRILSRFSTDIGIVDHILSRFADNLFQLLCTVLALAVVVCYLIPPVIIVIVISGTLYMFQVMAIDRSNREIKRETNLAMSPLQTRLNECVNGRISMRALRSSPSFVFKFHSACNDWNRLSFMSLSIINFSMLLAYFLSFFISTSTGLFIVLGNMDPARSGLALTYSLLIPYFALHCAFVITIVQTALSSLERVTEFTGEDVPREPEWRIEGDPATRLGEMKRLGSSCVPDQEYWPVSGNIQFIDVSLSYREGLPPAIRNVSFEIEGGQRVGVCGRTGAGKSSLLLLLFRVIEPTGGRILLDHLDISKLGLVTLREAFSIIPQEPLLMRGTVRTNLSPFGGHSDQALADAVVQAGLVHSKGGESEVDSALELLDLDIGQEASALSSGQRQLLSFARTLLRPGAIIVCDEPTSNIDERTDGFIQKRLRAMSGSTCIVIAHRINTIIDSDKILVMENGKVVEFDTPKNLLALPRGKFAALAADKEHLQ